MMRIGTRVALIRMSPLTMTSEVRMRMAAVWKTAIDNVARRVDLNYIRLRDGSGPGRTAEPSLVLTLLLAQIIILPIVRDGEIAIVSGEGSRGSEGSAAGAEGEPH